METSEKTTVAHRIISTILFIIPPFVAGNITHWAATVIDGKRLSRRSRIAIGVGSFGIAMFVHHLCMRFKVSSNTEYIYIWLECICVTPLLKLAHHELGDIIKGWFRQTLNNILNSDFLKKNK